MDNKQEVHNLIILDESGSMESCKNLIIEGFNSLVQTIHNAEKEFPDQNHTFTLVTFSGRGIKTRRFKLTACSLKPFNAEMYHPESSTPLYDALGVSIPRLRYSIPKDTPHHVHVTIFTDGEENSSKEYSGDAIKQMIEELKEKNWSFTYIGTDHDITRVARGLSIDDTMAFEKSKRGIEEMFSKDAEKRMYYYESISKDRGIRPPQTKPNSESQSENPKSDYES